MADPQSQSYRDIAITPPGLDELSLGIYSETRGTDAAIAKRKRQEKIKEDARARSEAEETVPLAAAE